MASGVPVDPDCIKIYEEMKQKKKIKYAIYRLADDNKSIMVEKIQEIGEWVDFCADMPQNECRYGIFDFNYVLADGGTRNKVVFIAWAPDTANVKKKMVYSSSKDALKNKLTGLQHFVQASDADELDYDEIIDKISKGGKN